MIENLAEFYRIVSIQELSVEKLKLRNNDIKKIVRSKDLNWIYECIRFYLSKPLNNPKFPQDLTSIFLKSDPFFKQNDNELELKVLTGSIIHEFIINGKTIESYKAGHALHSGLFGISTDHIIVPVVIQNVEDYLLVRAVEERKTSIVDEKKYPEVNNELADVSLATLQKKFKHFQEVLIGIISNFDDQLRNLKNNFYVQNEELNIYWWVFNNYTKGRKRIEIEHENISMFVGHEMSTLVKILPSPPSAVEFLMKVLGDSKIDYNETVSLKDSINNLDESFKTEIAETVSPILGNLTPLHFACIKWSESKDNESWVAPFEKQSGIKTDVKVSRIQLAYQFYLEGLLNK